MVKEDILGGIRNAVARGGSLKDAMQSFYNAGYPKEEIEAAAREFQREQMQGSSVQPSNQQINRQNPSQQNPQQQPTSSQPVSSSMPVQPVQRASPQPVQQTNTGVVSQYPQKSNKTGWIIFFIVLLVILIITGVLLFVFKDKIISLLNGSA